MQIRKQIQHLFSRGMRHWFWVTALLFLGMSLGHHLGKFDLWVHASYKLYQFFNSFDWLPFEADRTTIVLIEDDEYWDERGKLARRIPINREYLAEIIYALDKSNVAVIALDFDLRSPKMDGTLQDHPAYQQETQKLIEAIHEVSKRRKVVLPVTVDIVEGEYVVEPSIFSVASFNPGNVSLGYINLPYDLRRVAVGLPLKTCPVAYASLLLRDSDSSCRIDSFSLAIARTVAKKQMEKIAQADSLPYTQYMDVEKFCRISSRTLLDGDSPPLSCKLSHQAVIVGGAWSKWAYGRGEKTDTYMTPVGKIGGVFIHANYVEALLDGRTRSPLFENVGEWVEIILSMTVAIIFSLDLRFRRKLVSVGLLLLSVFIFSFLSFSTLGMFFDFFTPCFLLFLHACTERIHEWQEKAQEWDHSQIGHP